MLKRLSFSGGKPGSQSLGLLFKLYDRSILNSDKFNQKYSEQGGWDKGFADHYRLHLKELVDEFEKERVAAASLARKKLLWLTPLFVVVPIVGWKLLVWEFNRSDDFEGIGFYFVILSFGAMFWFIKTSIVTYQSSIKNKIFPRILNFVGEFTFTAEVTDKVELFKDSGLIPSYSIENSEDYIAGEYDGVRIELFETHLQKRRTGKHQRYVTVFNGLIINFSMNKKFNGKTLVKQDKGSVGNWFSTRSTKLANVKLEDPKFENLFEVYSSDQIEARYLLTVSFMERLLELAEIFENAKIELCFENENLLMTIPLRKPIFEPGPVTEPETFIDDAQSLLKEMHLIFQIIETLKLNMKLNL
jgi:hypothetical protein